MTNKQVGEYVWLIVVKINCGLNPEVEVGFLWPIVFSEQMRESLLRAVSTD
jgi:hypothetical protein